MKRMIASLMVWAIILSSGSAANAAGFGRSSDISGAAVLLDCYDYSGNLFLKGSGFAAIEEGIILTNAYMTDGAASLKATVVDGTVFDITRDGFLASDWEADVAILMNADLLIILSDIDGLYTGNPREDENAKRISYVEEITDEMLGFSKGAGSKLGTGGMYTKIQAAEICVRSGIDMIIAKSSLPEVIERIMAGEELGTFFKGENVHPQLKKRDIIIGTAVKGKVFVDLGCRNAILKNGSSLLPVGITGIEGHFTEGDTVSVIYENEELARGITHYSSDDIEMIKGHHTKNLKSALGFEPPYDTVIHRDNLLVMK